MRFDFSHFDLLSLLLGGLGGVVLLAVFLVPHVIRLERDRALLRARSMMDETTLNAMGDRFKVMANDALQGQHQSFLALAAEKLGGVQKDAAFDLEKRQKAIAELVDPIGKTLKDVGVRLETLGQTGAVLDAHLKNFAEDQKLLRDQTRSLVHAMRNSQARGNWGEMQLTRILEMVGMVQNTHFRQQVSVSNDQVRDRPDFIIDLPGKISIVIDVKTPLEPYWEMTDHDGSSQMSDVQIKNFSEHLRNHVKSLSAKDYWQKFDSPQFVVMFLPTEGLFSLAVSSDKTLIEFAADKDIILASPTTVFGLLKVIMYGWQQQALANNARTIGDMAIELNARMRKFFDNFVKIGRNLDTASKAYNEAIATAESRILPHLRKMNELQEQTSDLPGLLPIDQQVRELNIPDDKAA